MPKSFNKIAASEIKLVRKVSTNEIEKYIEDKLDSGEINDYMGKSVYNTIANNIINYAIDNRLFLEKIYNIGNDIFISKLIRKGYFLNRIDEMNDYHKNLVAAVIYNFRNNYINYEEIKSKLLLDNDNVRSGFADSYDNEIKDLLLYDKSEQIRCILAQRRYKLDILINDPSPLIRSFIASKNRHLAGKLINDESVNVRKIVANYSEYKDQLKEDPDDEVREIANMSEFMGVSVLNGYIMDIRNRYPNIIYSAKPSSWI